MKKYYIRKDGVPFLGNYKMEKSEIGWRQVYPDGKSASFHQTPDEADFEEKVKSGEWVEVFGDFKSDYASLPLKERKIQFLTDTKDFYAQNPKKLRAFFPNGACHYPPRNENFGCAIGRHLKLEDAEFFHENGNNAIWGLLVAYKDSDRLPEWMKEMGESFLSNVQYFHDDHYNFWNDKELTESGQRRFESLKAQVEAGDF